MIIGILCTMLSVGTAAYADDFYLLTDGQGDNKTITFELKGETSSDNATNIFDSIKIISDANTMYYCVNHKKTDEISVENPDMLKNYISKYSDFSGTEWFADDVLLPMYFNVLNGYEDGSLKPNGAITPAEVAKVMSATFEDGLGKGSTNWYDMYYKYCSRAFPYDAYSKMGGNYDVYMSQYQMTRAEIAYVIANYVDAGSGELASYISSAKAGNLGSLANFTDCGNLAQDDDGTYAKDMEIIRANWIPSRYAGALSYLVDKGVFMGNDDGTMSPLSPVKRAEVFALLNRVCEATPSYKSGQFKSDTALGNIQTSKPSTSTSNKGNQGWYSGKTTNYAEWQARPAMTLDLTDGTRGRAKVGDTVITADGTSYLLEGSGIYVGDTEVAGVGLPVAADLGRVDSYGCPIKDRDKPDTHEFGWISSDVSTAGQTYIVYSRTGEGHWSVEWDAIQDATKPQTPGSYDGEISADGYWGYKTTSGWTFLPNC